MLNVEHINVGYKDLQVLWDVSFQVNQGELVALIGPNGAGKTTTLKAIMGLRRPWSGTIYFEGQNLCKVPAHKTAELGIAMVPEGGRVFTGLTVLENLELGAFAPHARKHMAQTLEEMYQLFPRLEERKFQRAGTLSGGERQMLAIARALMSRPKLLMLDEPSFGLAPLLVDRIFAKIKEINQAGMTILLVEQNVRAALELAHRSYVIQNGRIVGVGTSEELLSFEFVRSAYLG